MATADERIAEAYSADTDFKIRMLQRERLSLLQAADRILAIDEELAILQAEKQRFDARKPTRTGATPVADNPPGRVR
jgi:hypothetical protein